jgi:hypothetical protein
METPSTTIDIIRHTSEVAIATISSTLQPIGNCVALCTTMVALDCYSAWSLSRRLRNKGPAQNHLGKVSSRHLRRAINTLSRIYAALVVARMVDSAILCGTNLSCVRFISALVCFTQLWSILENESSSNNAPWARLAQRWLIDKTERHLGIDLTELKDAPLSHKNNNDK